MCTFGILYSSSQTEFFKPAADKSDGPIKLVRVSGIEPGSKGAQKRSGQDIGRVMDPAEDAGEAKKDSQD
jgi:hypothetical protein